MFYTIGQRQGLGIGGLQNASEEPWFVVDKDLDNNVLLVAQGHNHPALFHSHCHIQNLHWINPQTFDQTQALTAKIRYRQQDQVCTITQIQQDTATIAFAQAQRAITPGQSLVFYQDEVCLGGGIIEKAFNLL
jgi:tRNA-uridine 2-sulfurtransferase